MSDEIDHPRHYTFGGIEVIDAIETWGLGYRLGNVVKYVARADHKGNRLQDLEKAAWYLHREIAKSRQDAARKTPAATERQSRVNRTPHEPAPSGRGGGERR